MKAPFGILKTLSCDTIAETTEGLSDRAYMELWSALDNAKPLSELIDIENSAPNDAIGLNTPAQFWNSFSDKVKVELLVFAEKEQEEFKAWAKKIGLTSLSEDTP